MFQMGQSRWWEQEIPMEGTIQKGELLTYNLTELIKPESYLVRLTPITRYGEGDSTERIITYSGRLPRFLSFNPEQEQVHKHCLANPCGGIYTHSCLQRCFRSLRFTFMHSSLKARDSVSGWVEVCSKPLSSRYSLVDLLYDLNSAKRYMCFILKVKP